MLPCIRRIRRRVRGLAPGLAAILIGGTAAAQGVPAGQTAASDSQAARASALPAPFRREDLRKDVPWRSYGEVTKNATVLAGVVTAYQRRDNVLLGLRPDQFDRDYLLTTQVSRGIGEAGIDGGTNLRSDLIRFHRAGDRVELWVVNTHVTAPAGTPMAQTVASSFGHSVAQSFAIATMRDTSEIVFDVTGFLVSDWADVGSTFAAVASQRKLPTAATLDRDRSSVGALRVFPFNLEAEARLTFQAPRSLGLDAVSDYRSIPVGVHYSLVELPREPMRPRYADDRVGYFVTAMKDFSRDTAASFFVRYVNRWRLEKRDTLAALSEPVRPIVYYLDRTIPIEWRTYVRSGILEWNRAFEEAGIKNAIRVLDAPNDTLWSAEDARYSTVRWTATNRSVYAIGPTVVDPRTGEILSADVLISAAWIQTWRGESSTYVEPREGVAAAFADDSLVRQSAGDASQLCRAGEGLAREASMTRSLLAASGRVPVGAATPKEYIGAALKQLVMHEIGHTLGLRHNFRGSAGVPLARMGDRAFVARNGLAASVMDYLPAAVSPDPRQQGDYYSPTIGSYDRWAIQYGYAPVRAGAPAPGAVAKGAGAVEGAWTPEREINGLRAVAARASEPGHLYASDEDAAFGGWGLDPTVSRYDLGDDPLVWARARVQMIDRLADSLGTRLVAPGEGWQRLRGAFTDLLGDRFYSTLIAAKYVGGAFTSRDHRGDPNARAAFVPVPGARQREALAFAVVAIFGPDAWRFSPELLTHLAPERWMHWGANPTAQERIDFPLHDWAQTQQAALLATLLDPAVLDRVRDNEVRSPADAFTLPDLFETLTDSIWTEVVRGSSASGPARGRASAEIDAFRRDGQREYLAALTRLVAAPAPGTPEDARALARVELVNLGTAIDRALARPGQTDRYTRSHLLDARQRIRQALDAQLLQPALTR